MILETKLSEEIWTSKYRFSPQGASGDQSFDETAARVAAAIVEAEAPESREEWGTRFFDAIADLRFIPAGRVIAGAGTGRAVTLFNCFVMGTVPDSLGGIFDHLREAALTMQQGGGVGMDFSTIRPLGSPVHGVGADASGPLSFMDCWDSMCKTVHSAGQRRGAMMGCLRIDHPDIEAFIDAKRDAARFRNFNVSVLVTDAFMEALHADADWPLVFGGDVFRTIRAKDLWERLMRATYDCAEPGVIFVDRVNQQNNLAYCEDISASNPCGEQMLPPYGACLLGSINLAKLVVRPFEDDAGLDEQQLGELTETAVRMLDNVIDISRYPLEQQEVEAKSKRRIGLGITGLADALLFCGEQYGSDDAAAQTTRWLEIIKREAYRTSAKLAAEKDPFPLYDKRILDAPNLKALDDKTRAMIAEHGLRNGCLTSIAPTGTTSLLAGNVSSGVEPVFAYRYDRRIRQSDGSTHTETVEDYAMRVWREAKGIDAVPSDELFVSAQTLKPSEHIKMQAAAQKAIDSSISKTVNCPENISFEDFSDIYLEGYRLDCKGMTTYRPNAITGSILSTETDKQTKAPVEIAPLAPREEALDGTTYKLKWPDSAHAVYITINDIVSGGERRPFEIFINSKNMEHYAWTLGLTRMISAVFRRGGDVSFVVEEMKAVFDPRGGAWLQKKYVPSLLAAIGDIIERHLAMEEQVSEAKADDVIPMPAGQFSPACPKCGAASLIKAEGCLNCLDCGFSKCG
ncbi:adenosylcobalamin-dependent ribonucleoside-diphosphate reductase [Parasphingorhabdus sp.]|uniref:adenosylcobalamin-dependent ribonucleoside-diphosphate reductase n=1 Tax=Parasphingorhabdus sp. TaxID=2709688 RepID=UPI003A95D6BD